MGLVLQASIVKEIPFHVIYCLSCTQIPSDYPNSISLQLGLEEDTDYSMNGKSSYRLQS